MRLCYKMTASQKWLIGNQIVVVRLCYKMTAWIGIH